MDVARRIAPIAGLAALALAYFAPLALHPSRTLYADHSDLIALHVPWETFLNRAWRASGEVPRWNPLQFAGLPFAHDVQAATSYPPHAVFRLVGEGWVGPTLSWLVVGHVILMGWGMYAYARATGLDVTPSVVAAIGLMFAGKWLLHLTLAGHYAFAPLAWLPWVAFGLDRAVRGGRPLAAAWAGVALGLMAMASQPQAPLYSAMLLAPWTLIAASIGRDPSVSRKPSAILRVWIASGLIAGLAAVGIAAVQLLPSLEAIPLSTRGAAGVPEMPSFSLRGLLRALGPSPAGVEPVVSWEPRSGLGVVWLAVGLAAPVVTIGGDRRRARQMIALTAALAIFAMGGAGLFQSLPLFRFFRQPSRMFLVAAFPTAYLAAMTVQALLAVPGPSSETRARARRVVARVLAVLLVVLAVSALAAGPRNLRAHPYWFSLAATVPAACWLAGAGPASGRAATARRIGWVVVLLVDVVAQTIPYVQARPLGEVLAPSAAALAVAERAGPLDRVLDRSLPGHQSTTPLGPALATELGLQGVRGYNALDIARFKAYIALIADPVVVPQPYNGLTNVPILHPRLLDLLGVRFLVQPIDPASRPADAPGSLGSWRQVATDPAPSAFTFALGGVRPLPPYEVLENDRPMPRAFVVPIAERLPDDPAGIVRAMTSTDFRRVAFLETTDLPANANTPGSTFRPATIVSYRPNRIEIDAEGPGVLVLADPWYPGWTANVDGAPVRIDRADFLFRGVALPPGRHAVTFAFRPTSVLRGTILTLATLGALLALTCLTGRRRPKNE